MINFQNTYPLPPIYIKEDGKSKYAYVTFVMRNDSFVPGALVFAYGLRKQKARGDLICMITKDISSPSKMALETLFDYVVVVNEIFLYHRRRQERQDRPYLFTRFHALRLGIDGDMGFQYEKIVLADADILPIRNYDHLFTLETPAGIINELKSLCMDYDSYGKYITPPKVDITGKWKWHEHYDNICPHGAKIPRDITDRVLTNPNNLGVNSALWVLRPSMSEYKRIINDISEPEIQKLVGNTFNWPEMQYATIHWSGKWTSIDLRFGSFNGYPHLSVLCGTHFAGYKPWNFKKKGTIARFSRFPDYALWHETYLEMMDKYDSLKDHKKLTLLETKIWQIKSQNKTEIL